MDGAVAGEREAREEFVRRYESSVTAYLRARWARQRLLAELEDTVQDIFLECFRRGGVLDRLERDRPGGFRAYLYAVVRNVARRVEERSARRGRRHARLPTNLEIEDPDGDPTGRAFDRAWARARLREAAQRHEEWAGARGEAEQRRLELLKLRFHDDLSVKEIAERIRVTPAQVYKELYKAHEEFRRVLVDVVSFYHPGTPAEVEEECLTLSGMVAEV